MRDWKVGNLLLVLGILAGVGLALAGLNRWLPGDHELRDLAAVMQAVVTMAAIIYAGIVAAAKLEVFRDFEPHLTISHQVNHRAVGDSYVHIDVTATLHNSSRVKVGLRDGFFRLREIGPVLDDQELEERLGSREVTDENTAFSQWAILQQITCEWENYDLIVEPGQTLHQTVEFVIAREIGTVAIHSFFHDSRFSDSPARGWGMTTVYDIIPAQREGEFAGR